jgi:uncharacterized membrane protein YkvI
LFILTGEVFEVFTFEESLIEVFVSLTPLIVDSVDDFVVFFATLEGKVGASISDAEEPEGLEALLRVIILVVVVIVFARRGASKAVEVVVLLPLVLATVVLVG